MDMWDFRMFVRECLKLGQSDEIIKILKEENVIPRNAKKMNNDLIDRTALLRKWDEKFFAMGGDRLGPNGDEIMWYLNSLLDEIKNAPTI